MLLRPGDTCWRLARADRVALFIDMDAYFLAARDAMRNARRTVHLLNWAFEPQTLFEPDENGDGPDSDRFGPFIRELAISRPELDVRILCWRSALPIAASQNFFPHEARKCFRGTPVKFRLDGSVPIGASHHQKALIVDDKIAFCGGGDIGPDRWDTMSHLDDDPRRQKSPRMGEDYESRHELMGLVDGAAAAALGELFRERWKRATKESLSPVETLTPTPATDSDPWPARAPVAVRDAQIGLARTMPHWRRHPEVRENERLHLAGIAAAKRLIYMENQYFTSPVMADALAARLAEPDGPEVVLVSTLHSPSYFDRATMDRTRLHFVETLRKADHGDRMRMFCPVTEKGRFIIVHAKLTIIDDELLRIGSANLNNRSTGLDTECDLVVQAQGSGDEAAVRQAIADYRLNLIAHWLHLPPPLVAERLAAAGSVRAGVAALDHPDKPLLQPLPQKKIGPLFALISHYHLGDPVGTTDNWRPWKRQATLSQNQRAALGPPPSGPSPSAADNP